MEDCERSHANAASDNLLSVELEEHVPQQAKSTVLRHEALGALRRSQPGTGKKQLFVDKDKMLQELKKRMAKPPYDVMDFYHKTGWAQAVARHPMFESVTLAVIGANALWISIDTDLNEADTLLDAHPVFIVAENMFCAYFFWEWLVRFLSFKWKPNCLRDGWFVFDSCLVLLMVVETWVIVFIGLVSGGGQSSSLGNASILRMARLLRLTRLARMARLLRSMPELMMLVRGMVAGTRSVLCTLMLLIAFVYVFAVAFRQLTDGSEIGDAWFPSVLTGMHMLIIHGAFMDDMASMAKDIETKSIALLPVFYLFVLLAALTLMNMLIGVLCQVVHAVASTEKETMTINYVREALHDILLKTNLDANKDGEISKEEFLTLFDKSECMNLLDEVGVDVVGLLEFADFLFADDDDEDIEKRLSYDDLMKIILDLRGTNTTTVKHIVDLQKYVKQQVDGLAQKLSPHKKSIAATHPTREPLRLGAVAQDFHTIDTPDVLLPGAQLSVRSASKDAATSFSIAGEASSIDDFKLSSETLQHLEAILMECRSFVPPASASLDGITKQVLAGLHAVKQYDQELAQIRLENKMLREKINHLESFDDKMPGVPDSSTARYEVEGNIPRTIFVRSKQ